MGQEITILEMLAYVYQGDREVLKKAVHLSNMEGDVAIRKLAEIIRHLSERSARDVHGKSPRAESFAGWIRVEIQSLSSDQWLTVAKQVMGYAEYKHEHSTI